MFWTNCAGRKKRVQALRTRPQTAVIIGKDGRTATFKGHSVIHSHGDPGWDELTRWFYPALAGVDPASDDPFARGLLRFLDAPPQVIIKTPPSPAPTLPFAHSTPPLQPPPPPSS